MMINFVLNPTEIGFIIILQDINNKTRYIGKENTIIITDEPLEKNVENECLNSLILFNNDEDGICEAVNEYRKNGIDARMYTVFRDNGYRIIDNDETDAYIKCNLLIDI